jgi:hypothetical protein
MHANSGHHYAVNQHAGKLPVPTLMKSLRRMAPFIRPYRLIAFFLVITVILPEAMELMVPRALSYVIDEGIAAGNMTAIV